MVEAARFAALQETLGAAAIAFTGREMTAADFAMHSRSECTLHRWDIVGRDDVGWVMLAQPELLRHALTVLTEMSSLTEAPARRAGGRVPAGTRVVMRSAGEPDVVVTTTAGGGLDLVLVPPGDEDAHLELDAAARLLTLWGRRDPSALIRRRAEGAERALLDGLLAR